MEITIPTPSGEVKLQGDISRFEIPGAGISLNCHMADAGIIAYSIKEKLSPKDLNTLRRISELPEEHHKPLIEMFDTVTVKALDGLEQLEEAGFLYFPRGNQLLVKHPESTASHLMVSFIDGKRAKCSAIWGSFADKLSSWLANGKIREACYYPPCFVREEQGELVEAAIRKLGLPCEEVGRVIRMISTYCASSAQRTLFEKLERGFSDRELRDLEEKSATAMKRRQRMRRYEGAQDFVPPLFLPDTGELFLDTTHFVRLANETPVLYRVSVKRPSPELGKYLTTGKWSRHTKLEPVDLGNYVPFVQNRLIETAEKADVPEPYRTRFEEFKSGLLARALQG